MICNKMKQFSIYLFSFLMIVSVMSCSDLEEEVYSDTVASTFYQTKDEILGAYMRPWSHTLFVHNYNLFRMNELTADAAAWTAKVTGDGYDGGKYIELHAHTWSSQNTQIEGNWGDVWKGVAFINAVLEGIEDVDFEDKDMPISKAEMTAELRTLRAYYYYIACDWWGGVPIATKVGDPEFPSSNTREEVYEFIEIELLESIPDLPLKDNPNAEGFFSKSGGYFLLAKLYLNSEVFYGQAEYQKCLDAINALNKLGNYSLDGHWQDPFLPTNDQSNENIFSMIGNGSSTWWIPPAVMQLHYAHQDAYGFGFKPWNGIATQETFFNSYSDLDLRKDQYLVGPQYYPGTEEPLLYEGEHLVITPSITAMNGAYHNEGARNYKYPLEPGTSIVTPKNDYVVFRYADVILMEAEVLMRLNSGTATGDAVDLVNQIRERAFGDNYEANKYTTSTLTMGELLAERGRELAYEGWRRNDLIRFEKHNDAWWEKSASEPFRNLFPIPMKQIEINPNLKQNPGY